MKSLKMNSSVWLMAASAFVIVTTEFVIVGLIPFISEDLDVSITTTGLLVTVFAIVVTLSAPVLTSVTATIDRKKLLLAILLVTAIANVLAAVSPSFGLLVVARVAAALALSVFWSTAAVTASNMVADSAKGTAVAIVFAGISIANTLGVPIGTYIGHTFHWTYSFAFFGALSFVLFLIVLFKFNKIPGHHSVPVKEQARALISNHIPSTLLVSVIVLTGHFLAFTYIMPFMLDVTLLGENPANTLLFIYGGSGIVGNFIGGAAASRNVDRTLILSSAFMLILLLSLSMMGTSSVAVITTLVLWGITFPIFILSVQYRILKLAPESAETVTSFYVGFNNLGIGLGAALGSCTIDYLNLNAIGTAGALLVLVGIVVFLLDLYPIPFNRRRFKATHA